MKTSKRVAINTLENDINTAISKLYNVSMSISKNARAIAIELIKMGYVKQEADTNNVTQQYKS